MGQEGSIQAPQYTVKDGFEREQFQKQHNANQPELVIQQLSSIGTDLSKLSPKVPIPMAIPHSRVLFLICNTYPSGENKLGSGPLNDSLAVASILKQYGYHIFFLHNTTKPIFVEWFKHILKNATNELTLFFAGRGTAPKEGEANGNNEVMLFDDGYVKDEELSDLLSQCRGPNQRTVLLSDCCHSGTFWDLQSFKKEAPQNVLAISSAKDSQGTLDSKDQGIFTFYFWKFWLEDKTVSVKQLQEKVATPLSKYQLHLDYYTTTPELENQPIFPKPEEPATKPLLVKPPAKPAAKKTPAKPAEAAKPAKEEKPATTERAASVPETPAQEVKPAAPAPAPAPAEKPAAPAPAPAQEEKPAAPAPAPAPAPAQEEKPAAPAPAQEEKPVTKEEAPAKEEKKAKSSSDEDDKSSSDEDDKGKKSSSDDEDDKGKKSSSDDEDDKGKKSSSDDEDDKSSNDEDDKSDEE